MDTILKIRRLFYKDKLSQREIARRLHLNRRTVSKQLTQRTEPDGGVIKIGYAYTIEAPKPAMNSGKDTGQVQSSHVVSTGAVTLWHTEYDRTTRRYTLDLLG